MLKQVIGDTHANVQVKVKRTRTVESNYSAHANLRLGFKRTSLQRELGWTTDTLTKGWTDLTGEADNKVNSKER
jgi:hypothetical protein